MKLLWLVAFFTDPPRPNHLGVTAESCASEGDKPRHWRLNGHLARITRGW
jgi:hypothetical protein